MRIVKYKIYQLKENGVYRFEREGLCDYDDTIGGDLISRIMASHILDPYTILEVQFKATYGYLKFKIDEKGKLVPDGPFQYESK